ncbi:uncharacterized protein NPIL_578531 [Nephila pilipes]|uniref:Integrase catalytic domain-containing protein n=1 Tax=Nephila pilipes TaxID=299642 RepID=A0A8X6TPB4_NEPPI|nr:uncharacterized protein NPIL_166881 [Nephila pilipes]GFT29827.1 uncharacterized protein NPIL_578531 [Nephila pilipes]
MHGEVQFINSAIKRKYWIVGTKTAIRTEVRSCVTCAKISSELSKQIMAYLPAAKVNPLRAFFTGGKDFAGPFLIIPRRDRGVKAIRMHVFAFVCFTTEDIHLERVRDLRTQISIEVLKRFIARRGKPNEIFSDCGTNFIGANNS